MGTYNGEKFLTEQIQSIINQTDVSIQLLVRDDGSSDKTVKILESFSKSGELKFKVGENLGFSRNYVSLLQGAMEDSWEYLAFSDQDDIWNETKISRAVEKLQENDLGMYASKRRLIGKQGQIGMLYPAGKITPTFLNSCFENICPGCTIVISKEFAKNVVSSLLVSEAEGIPYDSLLYMIAVDRHMLYFDQDSYIDYRLHAGNTIGIESSTSRWSMKKLVHFKEELSRKFEFIYGDSPLVITSSNRKDIRVILEYSFSLKRLLKILRFSTLRQNTFQDFLLKVFVSIIGLGLNLKEN